MNNEHFQPIDRVFIPLLIGLSLVIGAIGWSSKTCKQNCWLSDTPRVRSFSWSDRKVGAKDTAFILTFDRSVNRDIVTKNLKIIPPLPGKVSWSGNRLAYTLAAPAPYGEKYQISLSPPASKDSEKSTIQSFTSSFSSRDRAFAYIGSQGEERGRLILYNLTQQTKTILTPPNLTVMDFKPYPEGDRLLFSATDFQNSNKDLANPVNLFTVTTGLNADKTKLNHNPEVKLILDSQQYQNNQFDIAADNKTIVVQRLNRNNLEDYGLWIIKEGEKPRPLKEQPGGDFLITPDSNAIAIARGEGIALLSLNSEAKPIDFLPKFGKVLSFSSDGSAAAMVNFNTDDPKYKYTQSLFYVNNRGTQKRLFNISGSLVDCQFNPAATHLYCLLTQLKKEKNREFQEQPYIVAVELKSAKVTPLLALPDSREVTIGVAPDGLGILFDRITTAKNTEKTSLPRTNSGEAIADSNLWLLIPPIFNSSKLNSNTPQLEQLPLNGFHPQWIP
jgi:hypothetical protein